MENQRELKLRELMQELDEYIPYDRGSHFSEYCAALSLCADNRSMAHDSFLDALLTEMQACLNIYQEKTKVVIKKDTITHRHKIVEWND